MALKEVESEWTGTAYLYAVSSLTHSLNGHVSVGGRRKTTGQRALTASYSGHAL